MFLLVLLAGVAGVAAQSDSDALSKAMAQGDLFESKHKYDLALEAYHKADKLAHHENANCYLRLALVERKLGDFSSALDDTKKAIKAAGNDKSTAVKAYTMRAILLVRQSGKPTDKKLREAEEDMKLVHITRIETDRVMCFGCGVTELKEVVGQLWRSSHLASPLQAQDEDIEHKSIILEDKGRKLKPANHTVFRFGEARFVKAHAAGQQTEDLDI